MCIGVVLPLIESLFVQAFEPRRGIHRVAMHVVLEALCGADAAAGFMSAELAKATAERHRFFSPT
jgi:hypothetical protein